jgi:hypothetical protein
LAQRVALPPAEPVAWDAAAGPRWAGGHAPGAPQQAAEVWDAAAALQQAVVA